MIADYSIFISRVDELFVKRDMMPDRKSKITQQAFYEHFRAQAWFHHCQHGDGLEMLDTLLDDSQLIAGAKFNQNFHSPISEFYQDDLKQNKTWLSLVPSIVKFKGERIGAGELYLPFVISGWTFQKEGGKSDGFVAGGLREIKQADGASLKPIADHNHRIIDELNATLLEGHRPGPRTKFETTFIPWFESKENKEDILKEYFTKLYPGRDVEGMSRLLSTITDVDEFYTVVGMNVLSWYKEADNWDSLVLIDEHSITNIADVSNVDCLPIKFDWVTSRSGDVRQHADGYVNIKVLKARKKKATKTKVNSNAASTFDSLFEGETKADVARRVISENLKMKDVDVVDLIWKECWNRAKGKRGMAVNYYKNNA